MARGDIGEDGLQARSSSGSATAATFGSRVTTTGEMFLSPEIVEEIERFVDTLERAPEPETVLATVLFTDLVGSSERASAARRP